MNTALSIAGSDSGGGAGIQADLATFKALGVWGTSAITCLTAQAPREVRRIEPVSPEMVAEQISVVCAGYRVAAVKIGMTYAAPVMRSIAAALTRYAPAAPIVLDPVLRATSGAALVMEDAVETLLSELLPRATLLTPNLEEARILSGMREVADLAQMQEAARRLHRLSGASILVKGGHMAAGESDTQVTDVLWHQEALSCLAEPRVRGPGLHGSGCILSAGVAACLAKGLDLVPAVKAAKAFVSTRFQGATG